MAQSEARLHWSLSYPADCHASHCQSQQHLPCYCCSVPQSGMPLLTASHLGSCLRNAHSQEPPASVCAVVVCCMATHWRLCYCTHDHLIGLSLCASRDLISACRDQILVACMLLKHVSFIAACLFSKAMWPCSSVLLPAAGAGRDPVHEVRSSKCSHV